jgi:hypothetical protein
MTKQKIIAGLKALFPLDVDRRMTVHTMWDARDCRGECLALAIGLSATYAAAPVPTLRIFFVGRTTPFHQVMLGATGME